MKGCLKMSQKELTRILIVEKLIDKRIKQKTGAKELKISVRQIQRLMKKYKEYGKESLIHKGRGKESNNKFSEEYENKIRDIIIEKYHDFGPTLAMEKLEIDEKIKVSKEKLRQLMIKEGIWKAKQRKKLKIHEIRERREREGELVQIDGSPHAWFEERGEKCCLLVYIDDATSKIKWLHFCKSETTNDYFESTKKYIEKYGLPLAFYSDRHSIFRVNMKRISGLSINDEKGITQYGRGLKELGIELIHAKTPQAKGRVERANKTLQDRLVKELRLKGISTIKQANKYAEEFIEEYNKRFGVVAKNIDNAHRELNKALNLDYILRKQSERKLSKNLTIQYENQTYQIKTDMANYRLRGQRVKIIENNEGEVKIFYKDIELKYSVYEKAFKLKGSKSLNRYIDKILEESNFQRI